MILAYVSFVYYNLNDLICIFLYLLKHILAYNYLSSAFLRNHHKIVYTDNMDKMHQIVHHVCKVMHKEKYDIKCVSLQEIYDIANPLCL